MMHKRTLIFSLLFFLSGSSALILEVMWQRKLVLVFGASAHATTAILTAFFVGLALGSFIGGKILNRYQRPIKFYALCELCIAISALLFPLLLEISNRIYLGMHQNMSGEYQSFFYQKFFLAIVAILPATMAMGATIPAINRIINQQVLSIGNSVSIAYGFNTLGAVAGTLLSGLYLLPTIGLTNTLYFAIGINIIVAITAEVISRDLSKITSPANTTTQASILKKNFFYVFIYFMMGLIALGYQIVWLRMMAIFGSNSIVTFLSTLTVYLGGFSLGSILLFTQLSKKVSSKKIFLISIFGLSLTVFLLFPLYNDFYKITLAFKKLEQTRFLLFKLESIIAMIMMLVPTLFMGLSYPAICDITSDSKSLAKNSGLLYFIGNLGSALGVSIFGLYAVHYLGLIQSLFFLVNLGFLLSVLIVLKSENISKKHKSLFLVTMLITTVLISNHGQNSAPFLRTRKMIKHGDSMFQVGSNGQMTHKILRYKTGKSATVIVKEDHTGWRGISIDDQGVASTRPDAVVDSKMLAHLPLLLHPDPSNALTVGFGSGGTSWSLTEHDIQAWAVEIEQEVIESAGYFTMQNHSVLTKKNFHLIMDDARNFLYVANKKFDVISTDVTNIQYKQNANLYTKEYFELMQSRLTKDGIACAWIPMIGLDSKDFKILLNTFGEVYPHASLWIFDHMSTYYGVLIGTPQRLKVSQKRLEGFFANPKIKKDLAKIKITKPSQFKDFLHLAEEDYDRFLRDTPDIHTDDKPILEFSSPQKFYGPFKDFTNKINLMKKFETKDPGLYFQ